MPLKKQSLVLTSVKRKLAASQPFDANQTLTSPVHEWLLPPGDIQRLPRTSSPEQRVEQWVEQRVDIPKLTITMSIACIINAPGFRTVPNPSTKQALKSTPRMHSCHTRNNIPGSVPPIVLNRTNIPYLPCQCQSYQPHPIAGRHVLAPMCECLTAACKAFSLANGKGTGTNDWVIKSLDD